MVKVNPFRYGEVDEYNLTPQFTKSENDYKGIWDPIFVVMDKDGKGEYDEFEETQERVYFRILNRCKGLTRDENIHYLITLIMDLNPAAKKKILDDIDKDAQRVIDKFTSLHHSKTQVNNSTYSY